MSLKGSRRSSTCPNLNLIIPNKSESEFLDDLINHHKKNNTGFTFLPTVLGRRFSLKNLYCAVLKHGGSKKVNEKQLWDSVLDELQLPKTCSNSEVALKRIYQRYLEPYERSQFPASSNALSELEFMSSGSFGLHTSASIGDFRDPELRLSVKQPGSFLENVPLHYRYGLHNILPERRSSCGMSSDLVEIGELQLLEQSLHSGLPNEVELSLNTLLILSKGFPIQLDRCHQLLELLMALVGVYNSSAVSYFLLHDDWRRQSNRNFLRFWNQHITCEDGRKFLHLDILDSNDPLVEGSLEHTAEYLNLDDKDSATDTEFHWVLIVAAVLRNLVQSSSNASLVASNPTALRFLLLCLYCESYQLRNYSREALSELPIDLHTSPDQIKRSIIDLIATLLSSEDRAAKLTGLRMLCRISTVYSSATYLVSHLPEASINSLISSCLLPDVTLLVTALETCFQLTCHSKVICHRLGSRSDLLDMLISFLSREAQSLGTSAIYKCTIMQGMDTSIRPPVVYPPTYPNNAAMWRKPPNSSFLMPAPPRLRPPLPQPMNAFNPLCFNPSNGTVNLPPPTPITTTTINHPHASVSSPLRCSHPIQVPSACSPHPISVSVSSTVPLNRDNSTTRCSNNSLSPSAIPSLKQFLANNMRKQQILQQQQQQQSKQTPNHCQDETLNTTTDSKSNSCENNNLSNSSSSSSSPSVNPENHLEDSVSVESKDTTNKKETLQSNSNNDDDQSNDSVIKNEQSTVDNDSSSEPTDIPSKENHAVIEQSALSAPDKDCPLISGESEQLNSTPIIKPENFDKSNAPLSNVKVDDSAVFKVPDPRAAPSLSLCLDKCTGQRIVEWLRQHYITSSDCNGVFRSAIVMHCQRAVGRYIHKVKNITPIELHRLVKEAFGHVDHEKALLTGGTVDYLYKNVTRQNLKLGLNGSDLSKRSTLRSNMTNGTSISERLNRNSLFRRDSTIINGARKRLRAHLSPQKSESYECSEPKKLCLENNNYSGIRRSRSNKLLQRINGVVNGISKDIVLNGHANSSPPNGLCNGVAKSNGKASPGRPKSTKPNLHLKPSFSSTRTAARLIARRGRPFNKRIRRRMNFRSTSTSATSPTKSTAALLPGCQFFCEWHHCTLSFASQNEIFQHVYSVHLVPLKSLTTRQMLVCQWANCEEATMPRGVFSLIGHVTDSHCSEKELLNALNRRNLPHLYPPVRQVPNYVLNDSAWSAIRRALLHEIPQATSFLPVKEGPVTKHMRLTAAMIIKNVVKHSKLARCCIRFHESHILDLIMTGLDCSKILAECLYECEEHSLCDLSESDLALSPLLPVSEYSNLISPTLPSVDLDD